eukprot:EG_transcript_20650
MPDISEEDHSHAEAAPQKADSTKNAPPRVLCCGDSLTAGFYGSKINYNPYAKRLGEKLGVDVDEIGMSGWRSDELVGSMDEEFCRDVFDKEASGLLVQLAKHRYAVCIIMAGTNDLAVGRTAEEILEDVQILHTICHKHGARTVALPIPESFSLIHNRRAPPAKEWRRFNDALKKWAATLPDKVLFVDMVSRIPFSDDSEDWAIDGLHMSKKGYSHFGDILSDLVRDYICNGDGH